MMICIGSGVKPRKPRKPRNMVVKFARSEILKLIQANTSGLPIMAMGKTGKEKYFEEMGKA